MENEVKMMEMEVPTLTFEPFAKDEKVMQETKKEEYLPPKSYEEEKFLNAQELKQVESFAAKIELNNTAQMLQYGAGAQKKIADFSEKALESVKTKDLGEVGDMLSGLVSELREFDADDKDDKGFFGFFRKRENKLKNIRAQYEKAEVNVSKIVEVLEGHQIQLLKDVALLDQMYHLNQGYFKELSMYILAGKKKCEKARNEELMSLQARAMQSGLQEDAQEASDYAAKIERFEKKVHDLELTRMVALQMAPQIRLIQNNNTLMTEKIQSTIVNTIPLWKSQMLIALGVEHSGRAAQASKEVSDMTNDLLKRNAERLKMATVETRKEAERGIVDLQTLKQTNAVLIETINDVMRIQNEGREKRRQAELELTAMEQQMKAKLLEISR